MDHRRGSDAGIYLWRDACRLGIGSEVRTEKYRLVSDLAMAAEALITKAVRSPAVSGSKLCER